MGHENTFVNTLRNENEKTLMHKTLTENISIDREYIIGLVWPR